MYTRQSRQDHRVLGRTSHPVGQAKPITVARAPVIGYMVDYKEERLQTRECLPLDSQEQRDLLFGKRHAQELGALSSWPWGAVRGTERAEITKTPVGNRSQGIRTYQLDISGNGCGIGVCDARREQSEAGSGNHQASSWTRNQPCHDPKAC
uniref:Transposase n=1 Tax=Steinernema glaseri TaxID=37863 RepID=A0A1I7ZRN4_9BILA